MYFLQAPHTEPMGTGLIPSIRSGSRPAVALTLLWGGGGQVSKGC